MVSPLPRVEVVRNDIFAKRYGSDHINTIWLAYHSEDVIILEIDLRHKGVEVTCWSGGKNNTETFHVGGDEIRVSLPAQFEHPLGGSTDEWRPVYFNSPTYKYTLYAVFVRSPYTAAKQQDDYLLWANNDPDDSNWSDDL